MTKRIAILGGSFNPPHLGHGQICAYVLDQRLADEIWVIPCWKHPFGKELASYDHRFNMCEIAFKKFGDKVTISDAEKTLGGFSYTIETLKYLTMKFPDVEFSLVVGGDVSKETKEWKDFAEIKKLVKLIEVPRGPDSHILDVSSTDIRSEIKNGEDVSGKIAPEIYDHIKNNKLYA